MGQAFVLLYFSTWWRVIGQSGLQHPAELVQPLAERLFPDWQEQLCLGF